MTRHPGPRWCQHSHSGLALCWGHGTHSGSPRKPQEAPGSCKSVFLEDACPPPSKHLPASGPLVWDWSILLTPDLLCSREVTCSLLLLRLAAPTPDSLGSYNPALGPGPTGLGPVPRPTWGGALSTFSPGGSSLQSLQALADLTPLCPQPRGDPPFPWGRSAQGLL